MTGPKGRNSENPYEFMCDLCDDERRDYCTCEEVSKQDIYMERYEESRDK